MYVLRVDSHLCSTYHHSHWLDHALLGAAEARALLPPKLGEHGVPFVVSGQCATRKTRLTVRIWVARPPDIRRDPPVHGSLFHGSGSLSGFGELRAHQSSTFCRTIPTPPE